MNRLKNRSPYSLLSPARLLMAWSRYDFVQHGLTQHGFTQHDHKLLGCLRQSALLLNFWLSLLTVLGFQQTVYAQQTYVLQAIEVSGNERTKDYVILREIPLQPGQTYSEAALQAGIELAKRQLNNTSLFGDITLTSIPITVLEEQVIPIRLEVELTERWYIFPIPVFELADRNFNVWWTQFNRDLSRVNYGMSLVHFNLTGHYDELRTKVQYGFTPKFQFTYTRPYVGGSGRHGLGVQAFFALNRKVAFANTANRENFLTTDDFGLKRYRFAGRYSYRQGNYLFHRAELKFNHNSISDSLVGLNPNFFMEGQQAQNFGTLSYRLRYDRVDQKAYPLNGSFHELTISKVGLGLFDDLDQWILRAKFTRFFDLGANFYLGAQISGKVALASQHPWYNLEGLGFCQDFVRGYDLYAVDGQHFALFKGNLKHRILALSIGNPFEKASGFESIPLDVYLKAFFDQAYVQDRIYDFQNPLTNSWLAGGGIGLDVVTFYDWVFRFEYSFNRLGENGLFLHFVLDLNTYEDCSLW